MDRTDNYSIMELNSSNEKDWDDFNIKSEDGSFYHTLKWKRVLEESFNYKSHYFLVYYGHEVVSLCPFFEYKIKNFRGLATLPDSDCCHLLLEEGNWNEEILQQIILQAQKISKNKRLSFILLNTLHEEIANAFLNSFSCEHFFSLGTMVLDLREISSEKIWNDIFTERGRGKPRKYIRRFETDGFKVKEANTFEDLTSFYCYYKENLEYKNAKPYSFSHFEKLWNTLSSEHMVITLLHQGETVAGGLLSFLCPSTRTMYLRYLSLNRDIPNKYHQTYFLYWDAILRASRMGYDKISFGSTINDPNDKSYKIKMKFGCSYKKIHSLILPLSPLFKIGYKAYKLLRRPSFS